MGLVHGSFKDFSFSENHIIMYELQLSPELFLYMINNMYNYFMTVVLILHLFLWICIANIQ